LFRVRLPPVAVLVVAILAASAAQCGADRRRGRLPPSLADREFWRLTTTFAEPPGTFAYPDSLVSNERHVARAMQVLRAGGGVYIGVGPEQNFSYITRLRPAIAFVVDIRRENRSLHLMYKALFELSNDRADFLARLFGRRLEGSDRDVDLRELFARLRSAPRATAIDDQVRQIRERLMVTRRFALQPEDLEDIAKSLAAFHAAGPAINYGRRRQDGSMDPTYDEMMTATAPDGAYQSYLATHESFAFVKELHTRNLIVPVIGDFGATHALRSVGAYARQHGARLSAFYASNVEVYLNQKQADAFCATLAGLPHDYATWFIGSRSMRPLRRKLQTCKGAEPTS
jgi:hypothetical protein